MTNENGNTAEVLLAAAQEAQQKIADHITFLRQQRTGIDAQLKALGAGPTAPVGRPKGRKSKPNGAAKAANSAMQAMIDGTLKNAAPDAINEDADHV